MVDTPLDSRKRQKGNGSNTESLVEDHYGSGSEGGGEVRGGEGRGGCGFHRTMEWEYFYLNINVSDKPEFGFSPDQWCSRSKCLFYFIFFYNDKTFIYSNTSSRVVIGSLVHKLVHSLAHLRHFNFEC